MDEAKVASQEAVRILILYLGEEHEMIRAIREAYEL